MIVTVTRQKTIGLSTAICPNPDCGASLLKIGGNRYWCDHCDEYWNPQEVEGVKV